MSPAHKLRNHGCFNDEYNKIVCNIKLYGWYNPAIEYITFRHTQHSIVSSYHSSFPGENKEFVERSYVIYQNTIKNNIQNYYKVLLIWQESQDTRPSLVFLTLGVHHTLYLLKWLPDIS